MLSLFLTEIRIPPDNLLDPRFEMGELVLFCSDCRPSESMRLPHWFYFPSHYLDSQTMIYFLLPSISSSVLPLWAWFHVQRVISQLAVADPSRYCCYCFNHAINLQEGTKRKRTDTFCQIQNQRAKGQIWLMTDDWWLSLIRNVAPKIKKVRFGSASLQTVRINQPYTDIFHPSIIFCILANLTY